MMTGWLFFLALCLPLQSAAPLEDGPVILDEEKACPVPLWQIGAFDGKKDDLSGSRDFSVDPFFVVGLSAPEEDWPCLHTGPLDLWAGGRPHTFTVCFELARIPAQGDAVLRIDTVDAYLIAPELEIRMNGAPIEVHRIPWEAPFAKPADYPGFAYSFEVVVPGHSMGLGENRLDIVSVGGCFLYYDALGMQGAKGFESGPAVEGTYLRSIASPHLLLEQGSVPAQVVMTTVHHFGPPTEGQLWATGCPSRSVQLEEGRQQFESVIPAVGQPTDIQVELRLEKSPPLAASTTIHPVREWEVHLLHFTHLDIGYTHTQVEVEKLQMEFLDQALALIRQTEDHPPEAQFRWLPEALWAVESYLEAADPEKRRAFLEAVRADRISLCTAYANELTGLCSEEELYRLLEYGVRLREDHGAPIDSLMLTDVPGCTWGMVPVMADCGIKYLSLGPNPNHRIGGTRQWDDRPFYWVSPCGTKRVLCWMAPGYGWFRSGAGEKPLAMFRNSPLLNHLERLEKTGYPYKLINLRYDVHGDNGYPDPLLADGVKKWNETYRSPRLILSTPHEAFSALEKRHGHRLPTVRGDFTPYWEDGAASTAAETGLNRRTAERLADAEILWTLLDPGEYPARRFHQAWRKVLLYDEHTWGSWNSISDPDSDFSRQQDAHKKQFARDGHAMACRLIDDALQSRRAPDGPVEVIEVFNTLSWPRTDLVVLPVALNRAGDRVENERGEPVPSQRLASGALAFLAGNVPGLASARFLLHPGAASAPGGTRCHEGTLSNGLITVTIDPETGALESLRAREIAVDLVDRSGMPGLNEYVYVAGREARDRQGVASSSVELRILDPGPLVATLEVCSAAPGASRLVRQVRLIHGLNRVDITNVIHKKAIREKEGVLFAFPFHVPGCEVRLDMPWAVIRPEKDQMEGACKNFFALQRWADISGREHGITLAILDAPLVQMGAIRTDVLHDRDWLEHIDPSPTLYSYVMNNYWETNYQAEQAGPASFEYSIQPHQGGYDQIRAQRFGMERHRPLIAVAARKDGPSALEPPFVIDAPGVVLTCFKPLRDGKGWLARLFAASGKPEKVTLKSWSPGSRTFSLSGPDEKRGDRIAFPLALPAHGTATLRVE